MDLTNLGLVQFAETAFAEKWGYVLGTFGNVLAQSLMSQKMTQSGGVGEYNTSHKDYISRFLNKRVTDCYGLVKAFLWWNGGNVKYNAAQDRNQETAYNVAKNKGVISAMPEVKGLILWMKGHAGIYIGDGKFIECCGCPTGMREGRIQNGQIVSGSRFTHWFEDTYITYIKETAPVSIPPVTQPASTVKFDLFGAKTVNIKGSIIDGVTHVQARQLLEAMEFDVYWNEITKTIEVRVKGSIRATQEEITILEKIVEAEAGGENRKGKVLVANVILNRVKEQGFPNTIKEVVFQPKQFEPTQNGAYVKSLPTQDTATAVLEALSGVDYSQGALFFRTVKGATPDCWHEKTLTPLFDCGGHRFYK